MNHDETNPSPPPPGGDAELEARVVAWVLGEAAPFEIAELERAVAARPELAILKRRLEAVHGLLGEAARPEPATLRLAPERRGKLLAAIGGDAATGEAAATVPAEARPLSLPLLGSRPKGWRTPVWAGAALAAAACLAVGMLVIRDGGAFSAKEARMIAEAKNQTAALEQKNLAESKARQDAAKRAGERDVEERSRIAMPETAPPPAMEAPALAPRSLDDPASVASRGGAIVRRQNVEPRAAAEAVAFLDKAAGAKPSQTPTIFAPQTVGPALGIPLSSPAVSTAESIAPSDRSALVWGRENFRISARDAFNFQTPLGGVALNKVDYTTPGAEMATTSRTLTTGGRAYVLSNGAVTVTGGGGVNTQGISLSTHSHTSDISFATSDNLRFSDAAPGANTLSAGNSPISTNRSALGAWAGSVGVSNVSVSGETLVNSTSRLALAGTGGPTIVSGVLSYDSASVSASRTQMLTVGGATSNNTTTAAVQPGDIVRLDPFTVTTDRDVGFAAASAMSVNSLASSPPTFGSRLGGLNFNSSVGAQSGTITVNSTGQLTAGPLTTAGIALKSTDVDDIAYKVRAGTISTTPTGGSDLAFLRGDADFAAPPRLASAGRSDSNTITLSAFSISTEGSARARRPEPAAKSTKDLEDKPLARPAPARVNPPADAEVAAAAQPFSTFSLHVADVSFRLAQAALARGEMPDPARIRPEEFYNALDYGDPKPGAADKITCRIEQAAHPVLQQRNLVRVALKVGATGRGAGTPLRLTVLLDTSGSMEREDRAATVRRALASLASLLGPADRVTLIGFARTPRLLAEALPGDRARELVRLAAGVPAEGGTNLEEALKLAGDLARRHRAEGAQHRIVLLTDGAANLGNAVPAQLAAMIEGLRRDRIALDACGVGLDGLDDEILEALTRHGDGRYTVLNSPEDADAGFAKKLAGAFRPAAENVKLQVRFNPARVGAYRLIGFEQHRMKAEDFRNDAVDAAELAAEEAAVALYQVEVLPQGEGELGEVFVRFRDPAAGAMVERSWSIAHEARAPAFWRAPLTLQLAGSAALLAEKLRGGAVASQFKLGELAPTFAVLRNHYAGTPRVEELAAMFTQARRILGE